jgi:hypothetical protein
MGVKAPWGLKPGGSVIGVGAAVGAIGATGAVLRMNNGIGINTISVALGRAYAIPPLCGSRIGGAVLSGVTDPRVLIRAPETTEYTPTVPHCAMTTLCQLAAVV